MARRCAAGRRSSPRSGRPATTGALERCSRAGIDVVRLNLSHGELDEHIARLAHPCAPPRPRRAARRRARRPARAQGAHRRLPRGRRVPGRGQRRRLVPGGGACNAHRRRRRLPVAARGPRARRPVSSATAPSPSRSRRRRASAPLPGGAPAAASQGRPGVHLPSERLRLLAPDRRRSRAGRGPGGGAGVDFVARVVRALGRRRAGRAARSPGRRPGSWPRSRPRAAVADLDDDPRGRRRRDGGPRRPRHRVPARGRAPPAEADHPRRASSAGMPVITATQMLEIDDPRPGADRAPRCPTSPTPCSTAPTR